MHLSVKVEFDYRHFQFLLQEIRDFTEEELLSEPRIGFFSSSKPNFRDLYQEIWLGETPGNSNPSLTSSLKNPKIIKL